MNTYFFAVWIWLNNALESAAFKVLIIPSIPALFAVGLYFGRRAVEKTGEVQKIRTTRDLLELRRAMAETNISIGDLNDLRQQIMGNHVRQDVATATFYLERAERLHDEHSEPFSEQREPVTQADMNAQAFAMLKRADNELASVILEKMAGCSGEEAVSFQRAQTAWSVWRKAESEWESEVWEGGTIRPLMVATRLEALTRERIATIKITQDLERDPDTLVAPYRRTPKDLPDHLLPGITVDRVRQLIGVPHYIGDDYWFYRFQDAQLQLKIEDGVVGDFAFVMIENEVFETILDGVGPFRFGELTFGDLRALYTHCELQNRFGARTNEFFVELPLGVGYARYFFGSILTESGRNLLRAVDDPNTEVESDEAKAEMRVNWFGRTGTSDAPYIWWHI
jgi:uncharacterized protein YecT (DUF1311 family)